MPLENRCNRILWPPENPGTGPNFTIIFAPSPLTQNRCHFYRPQRSCEGYVFTSVCLSFCSQGEVSKHTPKGEVEESGGGGWGCLGQHPGGKLRGLAIRGVSRPTPGGCLPGGKFELTVFELTIHFKHEMIGKHFTET